MFTFSIFSHYNWQVIYYPKIGLTLQEKAEIYGSYLTKRFLLALNARSIAHRPPVFWVLRPLGNKIFNHEVAINLLCRKQEQVLHVICNYKYFGNATWNVSKSSHDIWLASLECWSTVNNGHSNGIKSGWESAVTSGIFQYLAGVNSIELQLSPIEVQNGVSGGERYHYALRRIFPVIKWSHPTLSSHTELRLERKVMNVIMGPEGLVPSLLVCGVITSLPVINKPLPSHRERMASGQFPRAEMATLTAELCTSLKK